MIPPILSTLAPPTEGRWKGLLLPEEVGEVGEVGGVEKVKGAWSLAVCFGEEAGEGVGVRNLLGGRRSDGGLGRSLVGELRLAVRGITCSSGLQNHEKLTVNDS